MAVISLQQHEPFTSPPFQTLPLQSSSQPSTFSPNSISFKEQRQKPTHSGQKNYPFKCLTCHKIVILKTHKMSSSSPLEIRPHPSKGRGLYATKSFSPALSSPPSRLCSSYQPSRASAASAHTVFAPAILGLARAATRRHTAMRRVKPRPGRRFIHVNARRYGKGSRMRAEGGSCRRRRGR